MEPPIAEHLDARALRASRRARHAQFIAPGRARRRAATAASAASAVPGASSLRSLGSARHHGSGDATASAIASTSLILGVIGGRTSSSRETAAAWPSSRRASADAYSGARSPLARARAFGPPDSSRSADRAPWRARDASPGPLGRQRGTPPAACAFRHRTRSRACSPRRRIGMPRSSWPSHTTRRACRRRGLREPPPPSRRRLRLHDRIASASAARRAHGRDGRCRRQSRARSAMSRALVVAAPIFAPSRRPASTVAPSACGGSPMAPCVGLGRVPRCATLPHQHRRSASLGVGRQARARRASLMLAREAARCRGPPSAQRASSGSAARAADSTARSAPAQRCPRPLWRPSPTASRGPSPNQCAVAAGSFSPAQQAAGLGSCAARPQGTACRSRFARDAGARRAASWCSCCDAAAARRPPARAADARRVARCRARAPPRSWPSRRPRGGAPPRSRHRAARSPSTAALRAPRRQGGSARRGPLPPALPRARGVTRRAPAALRVAMGPLPRTVKWMAAPHGRPSSSGCALHAAKFLARDRLTNLRAATWIIAVANARLLHGSTRRSALARARAAPAARVALPIDADPVAKALLVSRPRVLYNRRTDAIERVARRAADPVDELGVDLIGGEHYRPGALGGERRAARAAVRRRARARRRRGAVAKTRAARSTRRSARRRLPARWRSRPRAARARRRAARARARAPSRARSRPRLDAAAASARRRYVAASHGAKVGGVLVAHARRA